MKAVLPLLVVLLLAGCHGLRVPQLPSSADLRPNPSPLSLQSFHPEQPVDKEEAKRLATGFLHLFYGDAVHADFGRETPSAWVFIGHFAYGKADVDIIVTKTRQVVFIASGPAVFWAQGRWMYDPKKCPTIFDGAVPVDRWLREKKKDNG